MSVLSRAEAFYRVVGCGGTLLDGSGNGHTPQHGSTGGADTNDPLWLDYSTRKLQYVFFPGSADNELSIAGLSNSTAYDYTVTYLDGSTDTGEETTDGSGNLVLGNTQANFAGEKVKGIIVVPDGGGATQASADFTDTAVVKEPFATFVGGEGKTWTISKSATGVKLAVVDRDMFLLGTDDYFEIADAAGLDFDLGADDMTVLVTARIYGTLANYNAGLISKLDFVGGSLNGYSIQWTSDGNDRFYHSIGDGSDTANGYGNSTTPSVSGEVTTRGFTIASQSLQEYVDGVVSGSAVDVSAVGDMTNAGVLRFGARSDGFSFIDMEFMGAAIFREALSAADIAAAGLELLRVDAEGAIPNILSILDILTIT